MVDARIGIDEYDEEQVFVAVAVFAFGAWAAQGQVVSSSAQNRSIAKVDAVQYLFPEQVSVAAGKPIPLALHFRIKQGLHINSHTPSDEYLIPTDLLDSRRCGRAAGCGHLSARYNLHATC